MKSLKTFSLGILGLYLGTIATVSASFIIPNSAVTASKIATGSVTQAKLASRSTGTTVSAGGVAISSSCGTFSTSSASYVDITNLSVTITTTGRPVKIELIADGSGSTSFMLGTGTAPPTVSILRGVTLISEQGYGMNTGTPGSYTPVSAMSHVDIVAAGTYTYKVQLKTNGAGSTTFSDAKLLAYEL